MSELTAGLVVTAILTVLIKGGVALAGHSIAWLFAVVIAAVLVFGGFVVFDSDWID